MVGDNKDLAGGAGIFGLMDFNNINGENYMKNCFKKVAIYLAIVAVSCQSAVGIMLFGTLRAKAAITSRVIINEVNWGGSSSSAYDEWIELKNPTANSADIGGWKIDQDGDIIIIPAGKMVPAGGYFLIANSKKDHVYAGGESTLNIDADLVDTAVSLSNTSLRIVLKNDMDDVIDVAGNGGAPLAGSTSASTMERKFYYGYGDVASNWYSAVGQANLDTTAIEKGTPRSANSTLVAPSDGNVFDGKELYIDADWTNVTNAISGYWDGFSDGISGIEKFKYAFGYKEGDDYIWTTVPWAETREIIVTDIPATLENGRTYYAGVKAINYYGLESEISVSDGITIDTDLPSKPTNLIADYSSDNSKVMLGWDASLDLGSGVKTYHVYRAGSDMQFIELASTTSTDYTDNNPAGAKWYYKIQVEDNAGNTIDSDLVLAEPYDFTKPDTARAKVYDGKVTGVDSDLTNDPNIVAGNWDGFDEADGTIVGYNYAVGLTQGGTDLIGWTAVPETQKNFEVTLGTPLSDNDKYYVTVTAVNASSLESDPVFSNGMSVDLAAPASPLNTQAVDHPADNGFKIDITWTQPTPITDFAGYEVAYADTPSPLLAVFTDVGMANSTSITVPRNNSNYFVFVRSYDMAGNRSSVTSTEAVRALDNLLPGTPAINKIVLSCGTSCLAEMHYSISGDTSKVIVYAALDQAMTKIVKEVTEDNLDGLAVIDGLKDNVLYYFSIVALDENGNAAYLFPPMPGKPMINKIVTIIPGMGGDTDNPIISVNDKKAIKKQVKKKSSLVSLGDWVPAAQAEVKKPKPTTTVTPTPTGEVKGDTEKKEESKEGPLRTIILVLLLIGAAVAIYFVFKGVPQEEEVPEIKTKVDKAKKSETPQNKKKK